MDIDIPPVTGAWMASAVILSLMEYRGLMNRWDYYYSYELVFHRHQYYRLFTSFAYLGRFSLDLFLTLGFLVRQSAIMERQYSRKRDYLLNLFILCSMIVTYSSFVYNVYSLGPSLDGVLMFLWSRLNRGMRVSFFGIIDIQANYLHFIYLGIGALSAQSSGYHLFNKYLMIILVGYTYRILNEIIRRVHSRFQPVQP